MYRIIFAFFFLSGFSSLVFEVIWARMLMKVFGTTSFAISTLLTAFMAGLALGSIIGGRYAGRIKRPLVVYALLEGSIGAYALVVPLLLGLFPGVYGLVFNEFIDNFYVFSLLRFVAVFLVLFIPTTMMGATLPIVSQWIARRERVFQGSIGLLYGANTLGACLGCLLAGFLLLPALGLSMTNTIFALVNFGLMALVLVSSRALSKQLAETDTTAETREDDTALEAMLGVEKASAPLPRWMLMATLGAFALTGAISMSYQVLWTRAYVIVLGSSTYSFTLVLTGVLIGLAGGSAAISPLVRRMRRPVTWFALTQFGVAASATLSFFVLDRLPQWLFSRMRETITSLGEVYLYNFMLVGVIVLIPSILQGMSFPLVVRAAVHDRERSGVDVGRAYAFNTSGAIIGSFAAGFVLMPLLGLQDAIALVIALNLIVASALAVCELTQDRQRRRVITLAGVGLIAASMFFVAPPIDRARLTAGMFRVYWARELFTPERLARDNPELLFYKDGLTATTSVEKRAGLVTLKANGKPEASDGADMATQVLVGLLPFIVRSGNPAAEIGAERSVMVGFGSGVTAGASLQWPLASLEVVEIEATMVEASRFFDHINNRPLEDPRMRLIESDGRNYLEYTRQRYDVIVSEPSNPWIAGVSALFTVEHFERVSHKLEPHGVFAQWVQLYEMSPKNVQRVFATFMSVFPHVHAFSSMAKGTDLILIGSNDPIALPPEGYQRAWELEVTRAELQRVGIERIHDLYGLMFMSQQEMSAFAQGAELNTDDNGLLEFDAPKDLILYWVGDRYFAEHYFRTGRYGDPRPFLHGWPDDARWTRQWTGELARSQWIGGKPLLAQDILTDAGVPTISDLPPLHEPFDALEEIHLVLHAESLDLAQAMVQTWPLPESAIHARVADTLKSASHAQAMMLVHSEARPAADGYSGELGLFYAYLLTERRYYRDALRQLDRLRTEDDALIVSSLPFLLLDGFNQQKRRRYNESFKSYLAAGRQLID
ncbi:MAG: fused MFS/spermidine synthase [Bradymonadaceae bacterium]|nr:fused MFS/spermidine synthase [Lujinxingiaceae bacterium]